MRVLVWQWGRKGAGPRYAAALAASLATVPGTSSALSLSSSAEILQGEDAPDCALPFRTYGGITSFLVRFASIPFALPGLFRRLCALAPDVAICAMPAALDIAMVLALRWVGVPFHVVVHDADAHPGDRIPVQMILQHRLIRSADGVIALSAHVAARLRAIGLPRHQKLVLTELPPLMFGTPPAPPGTHGGRLRLLSFGRLLPYKGLGLLADAMHALGPRDDVELRVVGQGPPSPELEALARLPHVTVENRWVPEGEVGALLAWSDALVLSHTEASQSGVAAVAIAARRFVVATSVGGIIEQLRDEPLARLCAPDAPALAGAIAGLISDPPRETGHKDPSAVWHDVATRLVQDLG